jgi:hypothetical protein
MAPADSARILIAALVLLVLGVAALWVVPLVRRRSLDPSSRSSFQPSLRPGGPAAG